jgi:predicted Zn-dependent peptidase
MRALMNEGTTARSAAQIAATFGTMGSQVTDNGFVTTTPNFETSFAILAEMFQRPAFAPDAFQQARTRRLAVARAGTTSGNLLTTSILHAALYGPDHPFAGFETERSVGSIERDDVVAMHQRWIRPATVELVIVGDVSAARVFELANSLWSRWNPSGAPGAALQIPAPALSADAAPTIQLVHVPGPTAWILAGRLIPQRNPQLFARLDIANAIFGGLTSSRLQHAMRQERGLTYSSPSAFLWKPVPSPSIHYALLPGVAVARADSAVATLLDELRAFAGVRNPSQAEFDAARTNRLASLPLQLETHEAVARQIAELRQLGLPLSHLDRYVTSLQDARLSDVTDVARSNMNGRGIVVVIAGDIAVLEPLLRAANLAPVMVVTDPGRRNR